MKKKNIYILVTLCLVISLSIGIYFTVPLKKRSKTGSFTYDDAHSLYINQNVPIKIIRGKNLNIKYHISSSNKLPIIKDKNGQIAIIKKNNIKPKRKNISINIESNHIKNNFMIITLPVTKKLRLIKINQHNNDINISNINSRNIELNSKDGDSTISHLRANNMKIFSNSGDMLIKHSNVRTLKLHSEGGDIYLYHIKLHKIQHKTDFGDFSSKYIKH